MLKRTDLRFLATALASLGAFAACAAAAGGPAVALSTDPGMVLRRPAHTIAEQSSFWLQCRGHIAQPSKHPVAQVSKGAMEIETQRVELHMYININRDVENFTPARRA